MTCYQDFEKIILEKQPYAINSEVEELVQEYLNQGLTKEQAAEEAKSRKLIKKSEKPVVMQVDGSTN